MVSRRIFIKNSIAFFGAIPVISLITNACTTVKERKVSGKIMGASAGVGHMLRDKKFGEPSEVIQQEYVIVGAGISGLSAARYLHKQNINSFTVLELDDKEGGNSASGKNEISSYPWGAHYLPLPNPDNKELHTFLEESDIITHYSENGIPHFNEYYLCHDPEERLYIHGHWQDGLIPHSGLPAKDMEEIKRFMNEMNQWKTTKGCDGKFAFDIPIDRSSQDKDFLSLDNITMSEYLTSKNFTSKFLYWYVDYCCRDDYGTNIKNTSAYAGIHYFACRKGVAANADSSAVLTWPEGNGFLVEKLKTNITDKITKNALVYSIEEKEGKVHVDFVDVTSGKLKKIITNKCIVASPQFVNKRILRSDSERNEEMYNKFTYAPWMIANISTDKPSERRGRPMSWDNVFYNSKSLGYINANHQDLKANTGKKVLTYYYPLSDEEPVKERMAAHSKKHGEWVSMITKDLSIVHKDIEEKLINIDVWLWGHGMIRPVPGFITSKERKLAQQNIKNVIFFAHSDLSGISIFEEAFHHGIRASKEALV